MTKHSLSIDSFIGQFDQALRTLVPGTVQPARVNPAEKIAEAELNESERRHVSGLMRINHTGEVCAQALYQGQSLTAKLPEVKESMDHAAKEEIDHLSWCEDRLKQMDSQPSLFNPVWYGLSFGLGAAAGIAGDKWSLGFVAETENQVCTHLEEHLQSLPQQDKRSQAILTQMLEDEEQHAINARSAGGADLPAPVKSVMTEMAKIMKKAAYRL